MALGARLREQSYVYHPPQKRVAKFLSPLDVPSVGHETTMAWGGAHAAVAPVTWEAWMWNGTGTRYAIRRHHVDIHQPLGRYTTSNKRFTFSFPTSYSITTSLVP